MMREQGNFFSTTVMGECRKRLKEVQGRSVMIDLVKELRSRGDDSALLIQCEHSCIAELALVLRYGLGKRREIDIAYGVKLETRTLAVHVQYTARSMGDRLSWTWRDYYNPKRGLSLNEQLRAVMLERDLFKIPDTFLIQPQHLHDIVTIVF